MNRPLDLVDIWMVKQNLEHAKTEGLDVVINRLKAQGYLRVAAAVEEQFQTPT